MAEDGLFEGLPPPTLACCSPSDSSSSQAQVQAAQAVVSSPPLKSAFKRCKQIDSQSKGPPKRLRFKTTLDASEEQVIEAMKKITSHIRTPSKFGKAAKLAVQLVQGGSVKFETRDYFFAILEAAMSLPVACTDASLRADSHCLFCAAQDVLDYFTQWQQFEVATWTLQAVVANDLYTDDSFVFSKATGRIKEAISSLPVATEEDDKDEATILSKSTAAEMALPVNPDVMSAASSRAEDPDPFGLDVLLPIVQKKDVRLGRKIDDTSPDKKAEEVEGKHILRERRECLILCVEIAARRYRVPWAQTSIDILVKHAVDNVEKFTIQQRDAIQKLWASVREQQVRRKQGKLGIGKLDMNAFEWLQEKYASKKISIRHAVGGDGDRKAEQWLG